MEVALRDPPYDPEQASLHAESTSAHPVATTRSATRRRTGSRTGRGRADGPRPRPAPQGQVRAGRHADASAAPAAHGVCGSDAMLINGRNRLACKIRVDQLGKKITVAPLPGLPVVKDLVVDMERLLRQVPQRQAVPDQRRRRSPERERRQSAGADGPASTTRPSASCARRARARARRSGPSPAYVGPAAIVNAHRFIFDSRDEGADERLEILADENGVWRCRTIFNCVDACPRGINITRAILEVSSAIVERRG